MISIGFPEFLLVALVILIFVGPERLPQVARWCGKMLARGRAMLRDIQRELERNAELQELKKTGVELKEDITGVVQEFGKMSEEVASDLKTMGDELARDPRKESESAGGQLPHEDQLSEDDFADEVELVRRTRKPAESSSDGEGVTLPAKPNPEPDRGGAHG